MYLNLTNLINEFKFSNYDEDLVRWCLQLYTVGLGCWKLIVISMLCIHRKWKLDMITFSYCYIT